MDGKYYNHPPPPESPWPPPQSQPLPPPLPLKPHGGKQGNRNLPSFIIATVILIFIIIIAIIIYHSSFKPKEPSITVTSIQFPSFSITNGTTVCFTFSQYAGVRNTNHEAFSHYDSSLQLLHDGSELGFMFIPAGEIESGETKNMAATFVVQNFPISKGGDWVDGVSPAMEMESRMLVGGTVRVWGLFTHRVVGSADCRFAVAVTDGSVLGFRC